jgi:hypothetical protein
MSDPTSKNFRKLPIPGESSQLEPSSLNDNQHAAIRLLVLGKTLGAVAEAVGVSPRTLYTWRQDPDFLAELERRREEIWSGAADRLRAMIHPSLDVIEQHLADPYDRSRFRAANSVLRLSDLRRVVAPGSTSQR